MFVEAVSQKPVRYRKLILGRDIVGGGGGGGGK